MIRSRAGFMWRTRLLLVPLAIVRLVWVPLGLAISKIVKIGKQPVKLGIAGQYMPIHPESYGQQWNVQLTITPVIPKLIQGTLFCE